MKKNISIFLAIMCILSLAGCGKKEKHEIEILVPAGSTEAFVYSNEEIRPTGNKIRIWAGAGLSDTEFLLAPVNENVETGYVAEYLTHGMPVELDTNNVKDQWFKIGVSVQNDSDKEPIAVSVEVEGVEVRIADYDGASFAPTSESMVTEHTNEFFITYHNEIVTAIISFLVALCTTLLTHFLGNFKLRYTEKLKIISELSKRKYEGISKIRENIRILAQYENLCITEEEDSLIPENIGKKVYAPACCYSYKDLMEISSILNDLHGEFGCCLNHTSVIYLVYIKNFFIDYAQKCRRAGLPDEELRWASVPLYKGIHKWYKRFDKELICSMNKPSMKYFAHSGMKYNLLLKIYGCYFNRTSPYKYMNDEKSLLNQMINNRDEIISKYEDMIIEKSDEIVSKLS